MKSNAQTYYKDYLQLEKILGSQSPYSKKNNDEKHDEMLFIISHQISELWFKQILHEVNYSIKLLDQENVSDSALFKVNSALNRIEKIQHPLINQLDILETMTPMDFLDFRDLLAPASGFQSLQFRELEIKMGLKIAEEKTNEDFKHVLGPLNSEDKKSFLSYQSLQTLPKALEAWLQRLPFTKEEHFPFWKKYKETIFDLLELEYTAVSNNNFINAEEKKLQLYEITNSKKKFSLLFEKDLYNKEQKNGLRFFSQRAYMNALFIFLYRKEPALIQAFNLLTTLININENFSRWRYRHALMAQRMLGVKMGTGGSKGHQYLKKTLKRKTAFSDLLDLSSYLIPSSQYPKLPTHLAKEMNLYYEAKELQL